MAPAISLRSAVALLGQVPALAGVDLDVEAGSVVAVLGPNGAGKTSLLLVLAGLLELRDGSGTVLGHDLATDRRALRRDVALLAHQPFGYAELTPSENLAFGLRALRRSPAEAAAALERAGITGRLASQPMRALSAGQQRRVGIAWLLARRPALWLLDEPQASLDEPGRALCEELVKEAAHGGATVVLTTHDRARAAVGATSVIELAGGVVVSSVRGEALAHVA